MAEHLLTLGAYPRAADEGKKILEQVPSDPVGLRVIANSLLARKEYGEAANEFRKTRSRGPRRRPLPTGCWPNAIWKAATRRRPPASSTKWWNVIPFRGGPISSAIFFDALPISTQPWPTSKKHSSWPPNQIAIRLAHGSEALRANRWQEAADAFAKLLDNDKLGNDQLTTAFLGLGNAQYLSGAEDARARYLASRLERLGGANLHIGFA